MRLFLYICIAVLLFSCKKQEEPDEVTTESVHIYTIEHYKVSCHIGGPAFHIPTECFVVITGEGQKRILTEMSFKEYEKGFRYEVKVLEKRTKINRELHIDETYRVRTSYVVLEILKKTKVE